MLVLFAMSGGYSVRQKVLVRSRLEERERLSNIASSGAALVLQAAKSYFKEVKTAGMADLQLKNPVFFEKKKIDQGFCQFQPAGAAAPGLTDEEQEQVISVLHDILRGTLK